MRVRLAGSDQTWNASNQMETQEQVLAAMLEGGQQPLGRQAKPPDVEQQQGSYP